MIRRVLTEDWGLVKVLEDLMSFLTRFFLLSESFSYVFYIFGNTSDSENMISGHWIATSTMFQLTQARCERIQYEEEWLGHRKNGDPSQHVFVLMQYTHTHIYIYIYFFFKIYTRLNVYIYIYLLFSVYYVQVFTRSVTPEKPSGRRLVTSWVWWSSGPQFPLVTGAPLRG